MIFYFFYTFFMKLHQKSEISKKYLKKRILSLVILRKYDVRFLSTFHKGYKNASFSLLFHSSFLWILLPNKSTPS